ARLGRELWEEGLATTGAQPALSEQPRRPGVLRLKSRHPIAPGTTASSVGFALPAEIGRRTHHLTFVLVHDLRNTGLRLGSRKRPLLSNFCCESLVFSPLLERPWRFNLINKSRTWPG